MKKDNQTIKSLLLLLGILLLVSLSPNLVFGATPSSGTAAKWGRLSVKDTQLVNKKGKAVQLKGVSTHGIAWFPDYVNQKQFKSWKKFGANTVRLALYSDPSAGYSRSLYKKVDQGVKSATKLGMYVIIDWHILSDGNPNTYKSEAKHFFKRMAKQYRTQTNIIYEICNEPNGNVSWSSDIKPYANTIIKTIRKYDKKNIILVGTPTWSQDVDTAAKDPITGQKNIMYTLHFYAATHGQYLRDKAQTALDEGLPIFVSEFSICDASGNGGINYTEAKAWIKFLKKNKIPFVAWNVSNKAETSSLIQSSCSKTGKIKRSDLSETGRWLIKQF